MKVYFVISLMMGYSMWRHSFGNAIENEKEGLIAKANAYSLGNLGFAKYKCYNQYLGLRDEGQTLQCSKGKIGNLVQWGIIPQNSVSHFAEAPFNGTDGKPIYNDFCGDPKRFKPEDSCNFLKNVPLHL